MTEEKTDALSLTDDEDNEDSDYEPALPEIQGILSKWTNYLHGWQDRYIVLKEGTLSYYKSANDTAFGCRGAVSLAKASVSPHQFDECRFDVTVNDCVWYLRSGSEEERLQWINAIDLHRAESGYGSENNLRRHGSMISLTSAASLSTASTSSFKRGRGLKEKLAEMETFRDILCRQIDTLQSYFDSCASAVSQGAIQELTDPDDIGDPDDLHENDADHSNVHFQGPSGKDLGGPSASILQQHGGHAVDFKGESFTFKATTAGIIATLSHCMELMAQREEAWRKRLEKEVERRKKLEDVYKTTVSDQSKPRLVIGGPDFEEGPHCAIKEDEFFDAVDASLDKLEEKVEEEKQRKLTEEVTKEIPNIALSPSNPLYQEINNEVSKHLLRMDEKCEDGEDTWQVIAEEGDLKVYKREIEIDGVVVDPLKATHIVTGITGHEVCHYFWDIDVRLEWDVTLESSVATEVHSEDTIVSHNIIKRVWPTSQRDALFWSHIRHVPSSQDETPDRWLVVNVSTNHPKVPSNKFVRVTMNVAMICETIIEPPKDGSDITRDNIKCKISYTADVNPGGWAPASVLRAVYKREYPRFLKRFTQFVLDKTKDKPILF
ncbi:ceramide transfer protein-like isoform X5 [Pecten maximus]|uniref:ceramide transfer protein-like isoform X5 n=1 Tax=Pecten maximus TaxID=6579 RepID=UPI0014580FCF|nr:ceramide transfer protein-like isoform X5 [Pecten maximus]